jgi:hypothetical protein
MVLGIGEGSIELVLEKTEYRPGEAIKGKAKLHLNAPKQARGLRAEFFGEKEESHVHHTSGRHGGTHRDTRVVRIYEQRLDLGQQRTYSDAEEFQFEFKVPADAQAQEGGIVGAFSAALSRPAEWFVSVSLDLPMSLDISKKLRIRIVK